MACILNCFRNLCCNTNNHDNNNNNNNNNSNENINRNKNTKTISDCFFDGNLTKEELYLLNNLELQEKDIPAFDFIGINTWAKVLRVLDGDTVVLVIIINSHPYKFSTRLSYIDCAELHSENPTEVAHAHKAANRLKELIGNNLVYIKCQKWDKFGRLLAELYKDDNSNISFNQILLDEKLAYPYKGCKKIEFTKWYGL
jgi:endonuclease YncB( thermonuclease family)